MFGFKDYNRKKIQENQFYIHTKTAELVRFRYLERGFLVRDTHEGQIFQAFREDTRQYRPISLQEIMDSDSKDTESILNKLIKLRENHRNNA